MREAIEPGFGTEPSAAMVEPPPNVGATAQVQRPKRRRWWPWLLLAAVLLVMVFMASMGAWLIALLRQAPDAAQISIQGQNVMQQVSRVLTDLANELVQAWPWLGEIDWNLSFDDLSFSALTLGLLALFIGAALLLMGVLTVVPLVVLASLACALLATVAALLIAAGAVALSLSPLWLPVLGIWWWWRRKPAAVSSAPAAAAPL